MNKERSLGTAPLPSSQSLRKLRDYKLRVGFSLLPRRSPKTDLQLPRPPAEDMPPFSSDLGADRAVRQGCLVGCNTRKSSSLSPGGTGEL